MSSIPSFKPIEAPGVTPIEEPLGRAALMRQMRENMLALYGPESYRELNIFGSFLNRGSLLTNDPKVIRQILVDRADDFQRTDATRRILQPVLGEGLLLAEGDTWRFQRRTMAPAFAPRAMDIVAREANRVAGEAVEALGRGGGAVNLLEVMQAIALEVAGGAMFSMSMRGRGERVRGLFEQYGMAVGRPFPMDMLLPEGVPSPTDIHRRRMGRRWKACIDGLLAERRGMQLPNAEACDLYGLLANARDSESGEGFDRRGLRDQFATMLIAGHETTALALLWVMVMVARMPELQVALYDEAVTLNGDTAQKLAGAHLHRSVILETLRLYPPVFLIVREARRPLRMAGRTLFKGDAVSIAPWLLHRHQSHWHNPDLFDPGRFLPGQATPNRYVYMPFGGGPRVCIGMAFALTEAIAVLAAFVREFSFQLTDTSPIVPRAVVTTYPDPIPRFRLERRTPLARAA